MDTKGLELKPVRIKKLEALGAGYTVARLKGLTPLRMLVHPHSAGLDFEKLHKSGVRPKTIDANADPEAIKAEISEMARFFIATVWRKIDTMIKQYPPFGMTDLNSTIKTEIAQAGTGQSMKVVDRYAIRLIQKCLDDWYLEQEEWMERKEAEGPNSLTEEEKILYRNYKRYRTVVASGRNSIKHMRNSRIVIDVNEHIGGGFGTATNMMRRILEILPKVYMQSFEHVPDRENLIKLIKGARPLIMAIADGDTYTLRAIQKNLVFDSDDKDAHTGNYRIDPFDPANFWIAIKGEWLSLEIKPEVLDRIEKGLTVIDSHHTGCPALKARGAKSSNVVGEMYNWYARLYQEFCIEEKK